MTVRDKTLVCRDCGKEFVFSVGEQEFYASRGLLNEPRRCPQCRAAARREQRKASGIGPSPRMSYKAVCTQCGVETMVPFQPTEGRPVYCKECYARIKAH